MGVMNERMSWREAFGILVVAIGLGGCGVPEAFHGQPTITTGGAAGGGGAAGQFGTLPVTVPGGGGSPGTEDAGSVGSSLPGTAGAGAGSAGAGATGAAGSTAGVGGTAGASGAAGGSGAAGTAGGPANATGAAAAGGSADAAAPPTDAGEKADVGIEAPPPMAYASTGWTATASITAAGAANLPPNAFDGDLTTRWTTGRAQMGNESFVVNFGKSLSVSEVVLDDTTNPADFPAAYALDVSTDGTKFTPVTTGTGQTITTISFAQVSARYLRVRDTGTTPVSWWSIDELRVYP
jgi:F5/8 type C domain